MTSGSFAGDFKSEGNGVDGPAGADNICTNAALNAALGGVWKAWVSTATVDAIDRLGEAGPWYLVDRTTRVFYSKVQMAGGSSPEHTIDRDEHGASVSYLERAWTATTQVGTKDPFYEHCLNWTSQTNAYQGLVGQPASSNTAWTSADVKDCREVHHLYCFEQ